MYLASDDAKKYVDLYWWMKLDLPGLPNKKPKIWEAFTRQAPNYGSIGSWRVSSPYPFMTYGASPLVKINNTDFTKCEDDGDPEPQSDGSFIQKRKIRWYGFTSPSSDTIIVAGDLVGSAGLPGDEGVVFEATMLHELIHFCRKKGGQDVYDEGPSYAFEKEAYGHEVHRTWQACMWPQYFITK